MYLLISYYRLISIKLKKKSLTGLTEDTLVVGLSRIGAPDQKIAVLSLKEMPSYELGPPLHSLVIPAPNLHPLEIDFLAQFK